MMRCTEIQFTHKACGPATLTGHDGPSPLLVPVFWTSLTCFLSCFSLLQRVAALV